MLYSALPGDFPVDPAIVGWVGDHEISLFSSKKLTVGLILERIAADKLVIA
jgi:riboflavin synthase